MLWVSLICCFATTLVIAGSQRWRPEGWGHAWMFLIFASAIFRILAWLVPESCAPLSQSVLLIALGGSFLWARKAAPISSYRISASYWAFVLIAALVMIRSAFPNFDVDSLSYHMAISRWLVAKHALPDLQSRADGVYLAYRFGGFEEFLGLPASYGNLPLWSGLMGGWTKVLTLFSVVSIVPGGLIFFRYLAVFLLLVDDHFFFSGQNRFVFLHPALVGLVCMAFWHLWRGFRGKPASIPLALGLLMGIAYDKYHGLFFLVLAGLLAAISMVFPRYRSWIQSDLLERILKSPAVWSGLLGCFTLYGLNWLETGTPVYPYLVNGIGGAPGGAQRVIDATYFKEGLGSLLRHFTEDKYRVFTYPGNLALKYFVVIFFPALILRLKRPRLLKRRNLSFALFAFAATIGWVLICNIINYETSRFHGRYPRFVFALTICGIGALGGSLQHFWPGIRFNFMKKAQHLAGIGLFLWIAITLDSRYFNVLRSWRPGWSEIAAYWVDPAPYDPNSPSAVVLPLMNGDWRTEFPALRKCLERGGLSSYASKFLDGESMILVDDDLNWPNVFLLGNALRPDQNLGSHPDLTRYHFLLVSKQYQTSLSGVSYQDDTMLKLREIWASKAPICETARMSLFRL